MKAISLWQPWASAIAQGIKTIETRGWSTKYRGPLAIHAARKWTADQKEFATMEFMCGRLRGGRMPLGAIVAVCELVDYDPLPTGEALEEYWQQKLGNGTRGQLFAAILSGRGRPVDAEVVAKFAGVEFGGSTWRGHMAKLRALDLVSGSDRLTANAELFG